MLWVAPGKFSLVKLFGRTSVNPCAVLALSNPAMVPLLLIPSRLMKLVPVGSITVWITNGEALNNIAPPVKNVNNLNKLGNFIFSLHSDYALFTAQNCHESAENLDGAGLHRNGFRTSAPRYI